MKKSIVLLSGGLDSAVSLQIARQKSAVQLALTFAYGQRAVNNELVAARALAQHYQIRHEVIDLPWYGTDRTSALTDPSRPLPAPRGPELDGAPAHESARAVWVPNRNGVFINIAAARAEAIGAELIVTGFNTEEAVTFPDNSLPFIDSINKCLTYSLSAPVKVVSYVQALNKTDIFIMAVQQQIPLDLLWSCYEGGAKPCGQCESCQRLERARRAI